MACSRDWIDVFQALLTPAIAIAGTAIAVLQWRLSDTRLRLELFECRLAIFDALRAYLSEIVRNGVPSAQAQAKFSDETRGALFLFDQATADYIEQVWKNSVRLEYLKSELNNPNSAEDRGTLASDRRDGMVWMTEQLQGLRDRFAPYMLIQQPLWKRK